MRRHLVLSLIVVATACLGADCDGGSSHSSSGTSISKDVDGEQPGSEDPGSPAPEPSAALIFGAGLLTAYAARRRGR